MDGHATLSRLRKSAWAGKGTGVARQARPFHKLAGGIFAESLTPTATHIRAEAQATLRRSAGDRMRSTRQDAPFHSSATSG